MSYTHEIYISSWVAYTPVNEDQSIVRSREDGQVFARDTFDGKLIFEGTEYDNLIAQSATVSKLQYRTKLDGVIIFTGYVDLMGSYDTERSTCELEVISDDQYEKILNRYDEDIDIITDSSIKYAVYLPDVAFNYTRNQKLRDVIQYIIGVVDSSITFDSNSFRAFDVFHTDWENLFIAGISDIILTDLDEEKSDPQTVGKISLKTLFDLFSKNPFNIYWYIDSGVFMMEHISQITYVAGSGGVYDLTNYKGVNWTDGKETYEYKKDNRFYKIQRSVLAVSPDFLGVDIVVPKFERDGSTDKIDINTFFFDIEDIRANKSRYPDSTTQFFLFQGVETNEAVSEITQTIGFDVGVFTGSNPSTDKWIIERIVIDSPQMYYITFSPANIQAGNLYTLAIKSTNTNFTKLYIRPTQTVLNPDKKHLIVDGNTVSFDAGEGVGATDWIDLTTSGEYTSHLIGLVTDTVFTFQIYIEGAGIGDSFELEPISGETQWLINKLYYTSEKGNVLGGADKYNYRLSLAYIDDVAGAYDMPDTTVEINGVSVSAVKKNDKILNEIELPLQDQRDIDFFKTILTNNGYIEPIELEIPLNGSLAKLTGEFQ